MSRNRRPGQLSLVEALDNSRTDHAQTLGAKDVHDGFDPARLVQARHLAGLTKKAVADAVHVSPAAIGQFEAGVTRPRPEVIVDLAQELGVTMAFFLVGRPHARLAAGSPHFRSLRSMRSYQRDKAVAYAEQVWELTHELERYVHLPEVNIPGWTEHRGEDSNSVDPAAAARNVRRSWSLAEGPVSHLVRRLEAHGVIVAAPASDPDSTTVDAFCTSELPRPVVVLTANRADDVYRHRFTAAHELGHLVMHRDVAGVDVAREREADQFAAEFLTPRDSILPLLPKRLDLHRLSELSRAWGVSVHSLLYRCRETGLISDSAASRGYKRLHTLKDVPGYAPESVTGFPHERPLMLRKAFELAENLTLTTLAERLGWSEQRTLQLLGVDAAQELPRLNPLDEILDNSDQA